MRKVMLMLALTSPMVQAESLDVAAHSVLRLPNKASSVHLEQLQIADSATLLLPATLTELKVDRLVLGRDARIAITPPRPLCVSRPVLPSWVTAAKSVPPALPALMNAPLGLGGIWNSG